MIQILFEILLMAAIFAGIWFLVVLPIVNWITRKPTAENPDSDCGTKLRKKIDELNTKKKELEELAKEKDVVSALAEVDDEIARLRSELTDLEKKNPS